MKQLSLGALLSAGMYLGIMLGIADVQAATFSDSDAAVIRQLADKFSVTSDQQKQFLATAQGLVSAFSGATNDQRTGVIGSIEDARYGGTMPDIQTQLDTLLATAKATTAGVASAAGTTSTGTSATGTTSSAVGVATAVAYVDRIAALNTLVQGFRYKQASAADLAQVFAVIQGIFNDRADSFSNERQQLVQVLSNAQVLLYRADTTIKPQIDAMITTLATAVPFDLQLAYEKQLYTNFSPLSTTQKQRILQHFQEMTDMSLTVTTPSLTNDFRDLLQFCDVAFFQDDAASHSQMTTFLSKVKTKDPIFSQDFGTIISTLQTQAPTVSDVPTFISQVQTLVNMRYGNQANDAANKVANYTALQAFLTNLINLPPFNAYVPQLTLWLGMVKADNVSTSGVSFGSQIDAVSTNDFMLSTYDVTKRASFMTQLGQMMNARYGSSPADLDPSTYSTNKQKLLRLLTWMTQISWFNDSMTQINAYISLVNQDPTTPPPAGTTLATASTLSTTTTPTIASGTFSVIFGSDISSQLTQLEQSQGAINSDNQRELFILSLYDVISRRNVATTADVARMKTLATNAATNSLLGATYSGWSSFLLNGASTSFDSNMQNQLYVDYLTRISAMPLVADQVQEYFVTFALALTNAASSLTSTQITAINGAFQQVAMKTTFTQDRIADIQALAMKLSQGSSGAATNTTPATTTASTTAATTPTPSVTTTPVAPPPTLDQQRTAARALLNARQNAWR